MKHSWTEFFWPSDPRYQIGEIERWMLIAVMLSWILLLGLGQPYGLLTTYKSRRDTLFLLMGLYLLVLISLEFGYNHFHPRVQ